MQHSAKMIRRRVLKKESQQHVLYMVIHKTSTVGQISSTIKGLAPGGVCVVRHLQPNPVLHLGSAYQLKNQHNFPVFYEVCANNLRPPQPARVYSVACGMKSAAPRRLCKYRNMHVFIPLKYIHTRTTTTK